MKSTLCTLILSLAAATLLTTTSPAQPAEAQDADRLDALLADEFARSALMMLAMPQSGDNQYPLALAATLLDRALELDTTNPQLWTFRAELAQQMNDAEAQEAALVGYLATGVDDEKAQYDLLRIRLARHQTLDEQYRALEQLLNSTGASRLSDPLRSRLASFAASLAQELVDPQSQAKWVVEAARLDPSNAEAATMLHQMVVERGGDTLKQGSALINVVRASPMDPWARLELAEVLAGQGAFDRATQQYQLVDRWIGSSPFVLGEKVFRELLPEEAYLSWLMALAANGNDPLILQIVTALDEYYSAYHEAYTKAAELGTDLSQVPVLPERLPVELELIRLAVLDGPSDGEAAAASFARVQEASAEEGAGLSPGRLAVMAAVFGPEIEAARELAEALAEDDPDRALALGWIAAREGDADAARAHLSDPAGEDPLAACGLGLALATDDVDRARRCQEIMHDAPGTWAALAAARRITRDGREAAPTRVGLALMDRMSKFPESLWLVDLDRTPWINVRLRITPARFNHLEPISAEMTIWNTTRFPIAIGENEVIRPRAILQVGATVGGQTVPGLQPIVVDIGRKLSLDAGERLIIDTRLDYHQFGSLRALNPGRGILFDTRLIVNPVVGGGGNFIPAATGGVSTVRDCIVQGAPPTAETIEQWVGAMGLGTTTREGLSRVARVAGLDRERLPAVITRELEATLRETMSDHYAGWDERARAWSIMFARNADSPDSTFGSLLTGQVKDSDSALVWLAFLARQVTDPESTMLGEAVRRQDLAVVAGFAETFRRALREAEVERERLEQEQAERERLQQQQGGQGQP